MVNVKDPRVDQLAKISNTAKTIYAMIEFVDIA
jgi:ribosome-binding ATPase YchF (GTP1/OBG family)